MLKGIIALAFLAALSGCGSGGSAEPKDLRGGSFESCAFAHQVVKNSLKSPSTAKFKVCIPGTNSYRIDDGSGGTFVRVVGDVDSQNSFGATVRSRFIVDLIPSGGSFQIKDMAIQ